MTPTKPELAEWKRLAEKAEEAVARVIDPNAWILRDCRYAAHETIDWVKMVTVTRQEAEHNADIPTQTSLAKAREILALPAFTALLAYVEELEGERADLIHDVGRIQAANTELCTDGYAPPGFVLAPEGERARPGYDLPLEALNALTAEIDAMDAEYGADDLCDPVKLNRHIERVYQAKVALDLARYQPAPSSAPTSEGAK